MATVPRITGLYKINSVLGEKSVAVSVYRCNNDPTEAITRQANKVKNMKAEFQSKDQNWNEESTVYWFELTGQDFGTGCEFDKEMFGVCESGGESQILDCDGCPITVGDLAEIAAKRHCIVTDEMRDA